MRRLCKPLSIHSLSSPCTHTHDLSSANNKILFFLVISSFPHIRNRICFLLLLLLLTHTLLFYFFAQGSIEGHIKNWKLNNMKQLFRVYSNWNRCIWIGNMFLQILSSSILFFFFLFLSRLFFNKDVIFEYFVISFCAT